MARDMDCTCKWSPREGRIWCRRCLLILDGLDPENQSHVTRNETNGGTWGKKPK